MHAYATDHAPTYGSKYIVPARNDGSQNKRNGETRSGRKIRLATARSPLLRGVPGKRGPRDGHSPSHLAEIGCGPATISDETRWMGQRDTKVRNKSVLRGVLRSAPRYLKPYVSTTPFGNHTWNHAMTALGPDKNFYYLFVNLLPTFTLVAESPPSITFAFFILTLDTYKTRNLSPV